MTNIFVIFLTIFFSLACQSKIADQSSSQIFKNKSVSIPNDENSIQILQKEILEIYDDLLKSTVRVKVGRSAASAVLVSADGYILTAAHVMDAVGGVEAKVKLHDGSVYTAICLGKDDKKDYGLMKINPTKKLEYSKMGIASELVKDEACIMFGHPASYEEDRPAIARIGFYKGINNNDYLKTSCIMMPGDSGGPLFNLKGEVVGVCSYIYRGLEENYYPSVDNVRKNWKRLLNGETINVENHSFGRDLNQAKEEEKVFVLKEGKKKIAEVFSENNDLYTKAVVHIESKIDEENNNTTQGTIIDPKGYIVAKSSEVGDAGVLCTMYDSTRLNAEIIGRDKPNDIVVLKINTSERLHPVNLKRSSAGKAGQLLGTVSFVNENVLTGILGLESRKIITRSIGFLGIEFDPQVNVGIGRVIDDGAAEKAGLQAGDRIVEFNNTPVFGRRDLLRALSKTTPNQEVSVTFIRNENEKEVNVVLGKREPNWHRRYHPADYVRTNKITDGFPMAFTHDMPLQVNQTGTPVYNLQGEIVGINIARKNRTSSLAIPIKQVENIVNSIVEKED
jgi:serine protease Do